MTIDATLQRLSRQPFRAKFHLRDREAATVELRGMHAVRGHADELLATRLAPAEPYKDGKQTPYRPCTGILERVRGVGFGPLAHRDG